MGQSTPKRRRSERGYVLVACALASIVLLGFVGLSIDLGRMYSIRAEAQAFVDSASVAAARQLDGSTTGLERAVLAANSTLNRRNLGMQDFATIRVRFGATATANDLISDVTDPASVRFVRVTAESPVDLYFMAAALQQPQGNVAASAVAGQIATTPTSVFPFSPFARSNVGPNYGLTPGEVYTMRWPQKATSGNAPAGDLCLGDQSNVKYGGKTAAEWADTLLTSSERGYIEVQSRADKRDTIRNDEPNVMVQVGQQVTFTNGTQQSVLNDLLARVQQDTNASAGSYSDYKSSMNGNGRRVVVMPINDPTTGGTVVDYGAFFLMPAAGMIGNNRNGAQQTWCAEYIGDAYCEGCAAVIGVKGTFVVRLVE